MNHLGNMKTGKFEKIILLKENLAGKGLEHYHVKYSDNKENINAFVLKEAYNLSSTQV